MNKKDLLFLYLGSLLFLSLTIVIQKNPGYMDSEFYYLAGKQIANGENTIPVIWNYLDDPAGLPNNIFTYWMPGASIISAISMKIFGINFLGSRVILLLLAAAIAPTTYLIASTIFENRMTRLIAGLLSIFSGYYLKFLTIPETILVYILLGGLFFNYFIKIWKNAQALRSKKIDYILLGCFAGFLHLTRVDGILFLFFGLTLLILEFVKSDKDKLPKTIINFSLFIIFYFLITSPWYFSNLRNFGSLFSPATSKAIWISTYDDTFIYPSSQLTFQYWLENGLDLRFSQTFESLKLNLGTFIGVQTQIIGLPLFVLGLKNNWKKPIVRVGIIYLTIVFVLMTFVFPLAGSRGGFLHSASAGQIVVWLLVADGFISFLEWGVANRNWKLLRSIKMFLPAYLLVLFSFTCLVFTRDVVGSDLLNMKWNREYLRYNEIESIIDSRSIDQKEIIMINNPIGYYYSTNRWSLVIPNSIEEDFTKAIEFYNVQYLVLDKNLPDKFSDEHLTFIRRNFEIIGELNDGTKIYEKES